MISFNPCPFQGAAKLFQAYNAGEAQRANDKAYAGVGEKYRSGEAADMAKYIAMRQGTPATAATCAIPLPIVPAPTTPMTSLTRLHSGLTNYRQSGGADGGMYSRSGSRLAAPAHDAPPGGSA